MKPFILFCLGGFALMASISRADETSVLRIGIIGLDTSHAPAFAKAFNATPADPEMQNGRVVAAYPHGSADIVSSASRIPKYTAEMQEMGIEICDSIEALLKQVDCVLLETNDGRLHLEQARQVIAAGKPMFVDKPVAASLADVIAIYASAAEADVPIFSSSSLRYSSGAQEIAGGKAGRVLGCDAYSPCALEPTHDRFYWYGIHGVETLYTCMGIGCERVTHSGSEDFDIAVGTWQDGRLGVFRGIRTGKRGYGGTVYTDETIREIGPYEGYRPLVVQIAKFFRTGKAPVTAEETIELYAFMTAAAESRRRGGTPVTINEVLKNARRQANER